MNTTTVVTLSQQQTRRNIVTLTPETIFMLIAGGFMSFMWWQLKRYVTKVDALENRVIKIETILELLGDIKKDISQVKTDVEVIKTQMKR